MIPALNKISIQKSKPIAHTITKCNSLLYYLETHPNNVIQYHASGMILYGNTDNSYLVLSKELGHITVRFYLRNCLSTNDTPKPKLNGPILTICQTLKNAVASEE